MGMSVFIFMAIVVVASSVVVAFDARKNRVSVSASRPYSVNTGALAWLLTCLLIWVFGFPYYLVRRWQVRRWQVRRDEDGPGAN